MPAGLPARSGPPFGKPVDEMHPASQGRQGCPERVQCPPSSARIATVSRNIPRVTREPATRPHRWISPSWSLQVPRCTVFSSVARPSALAMIYRRRSSAKAFQSRGMRARRRAREGGGRCRFRVPRWKMWPSSGAPPVERSKQCVARLEILTIFLRFVLDLTQVLWCFWFHPVR